MSLFPLLLSPVLALSALAAPGRPPEGCALSASLSLPTYGAAQGTQGELRVQVRCPDAARRFRLNWPAATVQGPALEVALGNGLRLTLPGAADELTGAKTFGGNQSLRFPVRAEAGQWGVRRGLASLPPLVLTDAGAGRSSAGGTP